jgi:hypothetical protein
MREGGVCEVCEVCDPALPSTTHFSPPYHPQTRTKEERE